MIPPLKEMRLRSIRRWLEDQQPVTYSVLVASGGLEQAVEAKDETMIRAFEDQEDAAMYRLMKTEAWGTQEGLQEFQTERLMAWQQVREEFLPMTVSEAPDVSETSAPVDWSTGDVEYLLKKVDEGVVFLLADPSLGLPTIHDLDVTAYLGFGLYKAETEDYVVLWSGGEDMLRTPGGIAYTEVSILIGDRVFLEDIGWADVKAKLQAKLLSEPGSDALLDTRLNTGCLGSIRRAARWIGRRI